MNGGCYLSQPYAYARPNRTSKLALSPLPFSPSPFSTHSLRFLIALSPNNAHKTRAATEVSLCWPQSTVMSTELWCTALLFLSLLSPARGFSFHQPHPSPSAALRKNPDLYKSTTINPATYGGILKSKWWHLVSSLSESSSQVNSLHWALILLSGGQLTKPEVLAPAGGWSQLKAAVVNGCDAVYFGMADGFNARARATNFPIEEIHEVILLLMHWYLPIHLNAITNTHINHKPTYMYTHARTCKHTCAHVHYVHNRWWSIFMIEV